MSFKYSVGSKIKITQFFISDEEKKELSPEQLEKLLMVGDEGVISSQYKEAEGGDPSMYSVTVNRGGKIIESSVFEDEIEILKESEKELTENTDVDEQIELKDEFNDNNVTNGGEKTSDGNQVAVVQTTEEQETSPVITQEPELVDKGEFVKDRLFVESVSDLMQEKGTLGAAEHLVRDTNSSFLKLGGVLHEIRESNGQVELGYQDGIQGFNDYVETTLNLTPRSIEYWIAAYKFITPYGEEYINKAIEAGGSKINAIVTLNNKLINSDGRDALTGDELTDLLQKAKDSKNREEFIEQIKIEYLDSGEDNIDNKTKMVTVKYSFFGDEYTVIEKTLKDVMDEHGMDDPSKAFYFMVTEYVAMQSGSERVTNYMNNTVPEDTDKETVSA